jgi:hypothetical protein
MYSRAKVEFFIVLIEYFAGLFKSCKEIQHHTKTRMNKDYLITIRNRPAWVYCYKMDTNQPEEYITLNGDSMNFAENYDKRCGYNSHPSGWHDQCVFSG